MVPVDERFEEVTAVGGPLRRYRVRTASGAESVVKYNAGDAERLGLTDADLAPDRAGVQEVRLPEGEPEPKARRQSRNKARTTARTKGADGGGA
ncbi:hypothetical protein [Streptomyces qinglanensis]|uniref:hypothetical protein n=1 Tax=Streptomyces qinglanensis TaxID=943816 RepID=UPI003D749555